jgi:hypothetical protein
MTLDDYFGSEGAANYIKEAETYINNKDLAKDGGDWATVESYPASIDLNEIIKDVCSEDSLAEYRAYGLID